MLELCASQSHSSFIAWHTLSTVFYILSKARDQDTARAFLSDLLDHVEIGAASNELARRAIMLEFRDFEDAMQVVVAESVSADVIVTRNVSDFLRSPVPAIDPEALIASCAGQSR